MSDISSYEAYLEITGNEIAAAILVLADRFRPKAWSDDLGHEICMGIRKGLFGAHSGDNADITSSILEAAQIIADSK
jgi:hypothetical protein